jgi:hypothetical protein
MYVGQERAEDGELVWMDICFNPGEAVMAGNTSKLYELVDLYPAIANVIVQEEKFTVRIPFVSVRPTHLAHPNSAPELCPKQSKHHAAYP